MSNRWHNILLVFIYLLQPHTFSYYSPSLSPSSFLNFCSLLLTLVPLNMYFHSRPLMSSMRSDNTGARAAPDLGLPRPGAHVIVVAGFFLKKNLKNLPASP